MAKRRLIKLFGRERESLQVERARACRAMYIDPDTSEVEITLHVEDNGELVLRLPQHVTRELIQDLHNAWYAINPPLSTGSRFATWQGMDDTGD